jgi:hypothetical protein
VQQDSELLIVNPFQPSAETDIYKLTMKSSISVKKSLSVYTAEDSYCSENSVWLGSSIFYFRLQVIYKSYRQVLTSIISSLLLLKQGSLDKYRLAYILQNIHKGIQHFNWLILDKRNRISDDLEPQSADEQHLLLRRADVFSFDANAKLRHPPNFVI